MRPRSLQRAKMGDLIKEYAIRASAHGQATLEGDGKEANRQYHRLNAVYAEIRRRDPERLQALRLLLGNDDRGVRLWAAAHLLPTSDPAAVSTLHALVAEKGPLGFSARMTLRQWEKGELSF